MANRYSHHLVIGVRLRPTGSPGKLDATVRVAVRVAVPPQFSPTGKTVLEVVAFDLEVASDNLPAVELPDLAAAEALAILRDEQDEGTISPEGRMVLDAAKPAEVETAEVGQRTADNCFAGDTHWVARNPRNLMRHLAARKASR